MTSESSGISPTHFEGVGAIRGMDVELESDDEAKELFEAWPDEEPNGDEPDGSDADIADKAPESERIASEEAPMRLPSNPSDPTPDESNKHNKTHLPHRPWCSVCVKARAREDKHYAEVAREREQGLAKVEMDYAQIEDTTADKDESETSGAAMIHKKRLLIGRDRWTKSVFTFLVKCKGRGDDKIVNKIVRAVDALGYRKLIIKTDGEPALVEVQEAVARARVHETICENPLAYDPQANGGAERAVQEVKAQMRAVKIGLEMKVQATVNPTWAIIEWMLPHAADLINRFLVGADGKTAYYRVHMRHFNGMVFEMGEQVLAKPVRKANWAKLGRDPKRKM